MERINGNLDNNCVESVKRKQANDAHTVSFICYDAISYHMFRYLDRLDNRLYRRIIDKKRELDSLGRLTDKDLERLERKIEVEFIYNTNSIEGNTLTLGETRLILKGMTIHHEPLSDIDEVKNHPEAIQLVKELAFNRGPIRTSKITERHILELHRIAMVKVMEDAGRYRQDDRITVTGARFTPTPWYEIQPQMNDMLYYINENPDGLSAFELAAHAHLFFVNIHPFHDGNGRIARLLTNFILLRNQYPFIVFKKVERKQYIRTLLKSNDGYFKPFLEYVAILLDQSLTTYLSAIKSKSDKTEELLSLSELAKGTPYSTDYLRILVNRKAIDGVKIGKKWMTSRRTINSYTRQHLRLPQPNDS